MTPKEVLEAIAEHLNITIQQLSSNVGYERPQGFYDIIHGKTKEISSKVANRITAVYPEFNLSWILTGDGLMLIDTDKTVLSVENFRLIPLYSQDVVGGNHNQEMDTNGYITGYMPFVNAHKDDICVPVTNDSMAPLYAPGTIVQIRKLDFWKEFVEFGKVHIIELEDDRRLIKVIRKGKDENHFTLMSHNPDYDDADISIQFIRSIWLVLSKYQKVVM